MLSISGDQMETNEKELDGWYLIGELRINKLFVQKLSNRYLLRKTANFLCITRENYVMFKNA